MLLTKRNIFNNSDILKKMLKLDSLTPTNKVEPESLLKSCFPAFFMD
jgi:hypothetical protein